VLCIYVYDSFQYKFNVAGLYSSFVSPIKPAADVNLRMATVLQITYYKISPSGPVSSVGIATDYGLDSPGSNPGGEEIFRPSRPALGPTQPRVQLVPGPSRGQKRPRHGAAHPPPSSAEVLERVELYLYSP